MVFVSCFDCTHLSSWIWLLPLTSVCNNYEASSIVAYLWYVSPISLISCTLSCKKNVWNLRMHVSLLTAHSTSVSLGQIQRHIYTQAHLGPHITWIFFSYFTAWRHVPIYRGQVTRLSWLRHILPRYLCRLCIPCENSVMLEFNYTHVLYYWCVYILQCHLDTLTTTALTPSYRSGMQYQW